MPLHPDRFAIDLLLEGPQPIRSTALFADVWRYLSPHSSLHGRPRQRLSFGLIYPCRDCDPRERPRLRIYSTDPEFSAALATQLLTVREIVIGRKPYRIAGHAAVGQLDAEYVDVYTPIIIKSATPNPDNPRRPLTWCVTHEHPFFHERLNYVMRDKLLACGFTEADLPHGPMLTMVTARHRSMQIKERPIYLRGSVGRWQLHGSPDVRRAMVLSGLGVKTGMGFGFAVPAT